MACASFSSRLYECASCCHAKISYCVCQPTAEFKELTRSMTMYSKNWWTVTVTQWGFSLASGGHGSLWPQWSSDVFNHSVQAGASKDSKLFWHQGSIVSCCLLSCSVRVSYHQQINYLFFDRPCPGSSDSNSPGVIACKSLSAWGVFKSLFSSRNFLGLDTVTLSLLFDN